MADVGMNVHMVEIHGVGTGGVLLLEGTDVSEYKDVDVVEEVGMCSGVAVV